MKKLRILQVEDNADDAMLIIRNLKKSGYELESSRVETAQELERALNDQEWDIVLSDYSLPGFDGLSALEIVNDYPYLPFLLVSGAVGEETAVEIMKSGAKDFIMKGDLGRLVPAVERELREVENLKEKEMLEGRLRQAQKMEAIGTMSGGIAHDFNNILTGIIGYSELARNELGDSAPSVTIKIEKVLQAGQRAQKLVQQILTFSRHNDDDKKPTKLAPVVCEALKLLRASLPSTIEFKENYLNDEAAVLAVPSQLHQIAMNLCTNASHAMSKDGGVLEVTVEVAEVDEALAAAHGKSKGKYLCLRISDSGYGIKQEIIDRIFEPYFTTKDVGVGTGLGLSLVHGIVKNHRGFITVHSKEGLGTDFVVYLPQVDNTSVKDATVVDETAIGGNERILVVDDEEIIVQFTKEILEEMGYKVSVACDGGEGLKQFSEQPDKFDLIITDMTMPKMNGVELVKECIKIRPDIPVILCTGYNDQVTQENAMASGIKKYLMKPVRGNKLCQVVRQVLDGAGTA